MSEFTKYTAYRIAERNFSSNIIEGGFLEITDSGTKMHWEPIVAPLVVKQLGDHMCNELLTIIKQYTNNE